MLLIHLKWVYILVNSLCFLHILLVFQPAHLVVGGDFSGEPCAVFFGCPKVVQREGVWVVGAVGEADEAMRVVDVVQAACKLVSDVLEKVFVWHEFFFKQGGVVAEAVVKQEFERGAVGGKPLAAC